MTSSLGSKLRHLLGHPAPSSTVPVPQVPALDGDKVRFVCNICGHPGTFPYGNLNRETSSCGYCLSTPRFRSIIHALSVELFGQSLPIQEFPLRPDIEGIGFSDSSEYPRHLPTKLGYRNTWFHKEPRLDITSPSAREFGQFDFVLCSEVMEHIQQPVAPAFRNLFHLLKPGGVLIFSVPTFDEPTIEHFPRLHDYRIIEYQGVRHLENTTVHGVRERFDNLVFHGGPGAALEMRLFGREDVEQHLRDAGLTSLRYFTEPVPQFGIVRNHLYNGQFLGMESPPWSARRPAEAGPVDIMKPA